MIECYDEYTYAMVTLIFGAVMIAGPLVASASILAIVSVIRIIQKLIKRIRRG